MADEIKVEVTLRWEGDKLYAGSILLGSVNHRVDAKDAHALNAIAGANHASTSTIDEVRAGAMRAAIRALKGEPKP